MNSIANYVIIGKEGNITSIGGNSQAEIEAGIQDDEY